MQIPSGRNLYFILAVAAAIAFYLFKRRQSALPATTTATGVAQPNLNLSNSALLGLSSQVQALRQRARAAQGLT